MTGTTLPPGMTGTLSLEHHRQQFPALGNKAYFNYGGQGPLSQVALEAIHQAYVHIQTEGPFAVTTNAWVTEQATQTRGAIAAELGVTADTITLTENVTVGCNIALWGIDWQAGDHLLLTDCEHPGIVAATGELQRRFGIEVSTCPIMATLNQGDPVAVIAEHLRPRTRLVVLSHILWNTGQVLPLGDIVTTCHRQPPGDQPVLVLVDAAQSVGVLPLNLPETEVDFYAFTGHKWWCGPEGVGGLYVRPNPEAEAVGTPFPLQPTFIGWRGATIDQQGKPTGWRTSAQRYEVATSAYPLYRGLQVAITTQAQWGTAQERYTRICSLSRHLWQQLMGLPQINCLRTTPPDSGLVSFQIPGGDNTAHFQLVQFLEQRRCFVRLLVSPSCVRACVHYLTLETEIDQLVEAIAAFFQQRS